MDFIVVGAGAVGRVLGTLLERAGHRVRYWARASGPSSPRGFEIQRVGGPCQSSRPPEWVSAGAEQAASSDWVLVCVRAEQLAAALSQVALQLGSERPVAIATVTMDGARAEARRAGLRGPVLAFHVSFGAGWDAGAARVVWFPFTLPSAISTENQPQLLAAAGTLARALSHAGLPARAVRSVSGLARVFVVALTALLPAWELSGWDSARLARDRELRVLTASAMRETVRRFAPGRGFVRCLALTLPRLFYAGVLQLLPWLMPERARALWRVHGPKIGQQTGHMLHDLLDRAERGHALLPDLARLAARWRHARSEGEAAASA